MIGAVVLVLLVGGASYLYLLATGRIGNVDRDAVVAANTAILDGVPTYGGATFFAEYSFESQDHNGWPEAMGPITNYMTERVYRLETGTPPERVLRFYREALGPRWREVSAGQCDGSFRRGLASLYVSACGEYLSFHATARVRR